MLEDRSMKLDLVAIVLAAMTLLLCFSLGSYHPADPPSTLVWPASETVQNACGRGGAFVAHAMFEMMGVGAYYAGASLAVLTVLLLMRRQVDQPILRSVGWAMSLVGLATLASMAAPSWSPGPVVGAGGYLGAMGRAWLESNFAAAGGYIFAISVFLAGLLLATDYFVFRVAAVATSVSGAGLVKASQLSQAAARRASSKQAITDLDDIDQEEWEYEEEDAEDDEAADGIGEEDDDQDEWEYEDEEEDDDAAASGLTIRKPDGSVLGSAAASGEDAGEGDESPAGASEGDKVKKGVAAAAVAGIGSKIAAALIKPKEDSPPEEAAQAPPDKKLLKEKPKSEREQIMDQLEAADHDHEIDDDFELPPIDLLLPSEEVSYEAHEKEVRRKAKILEKTFGDFGFNVKVVEVETGPVIAQYEVELEAGLRLSKITGLADDLAIALRAPSVRIVAPIPGKNTVGIEVPNENRQLVRLREVIEETDGRAKRMKIPIYLGKDVAGNSMAVDLAALPHLLIAGRTGTGKSVCLNSIILSILMSRGPDEVRMLMIDPKMVELSGYRKLPHLMHPVVTDMKKAEAILAWAVDKMEERYQLLAKAGVRHVSVYNQLSEEELRERLESADGHSMDEAEWSLVPKQLPFIVIVADEMADLMMTAGKDVEAHIIRLAQKSRAVGIHLILATQKPTVDVITGLIKSNLPARIAFQVASRTDSRVVLDEMGADKLLGNGDMLFLSPGTSMLLRGQGTYLSDDEITKVVDFVGTDDQQFAAELMQLKTKEEEEASGDGAALKKRDDMYEAAVDVVVREGRGSVSLLQRCLGIGYGRAARLIDYMAEDKIVGPYNGSNAREVLVTVEQWEAMSAGNGDDSESAPTASPTVPQTATPSSLAAATTSAPWEDTNDNTEADAADEDDEALAEDEEWEEEDEGDAEYEEDELEEDEEAAEGEDDEADDDEWEYEEEDDAEEEAAEEDDDEEWEYEEEEEDDAA